LKLPLFISVPHAGTRVPPEVRGFCVLRPEDILADCDEGAESIYGLLQEHAAGFCTTDIARSLIDLNRSPDDIGGNGVIKHRTCWNVQVFKPFPDGKLVQGLLKRYYFPYHEKLSAGAASPAVRLGVDCHTMAPVGPPVGPDPGRERPMVCISNGDGTCPEKWISSLASSFAEVFREKVAINTPFRGGYICRSHAAEMPWVQIEISQTAAYPITLKRDYLLEGLHRFCHTVF